MSDGEIRCTCSRRPLLAIHGRDTKTGEPFIHVKAHKQERILAEVIVTAGVARIHCRECLHWFTVRIVRTGLSMTEERLPESLPVA